MYTFYNMLHQYVCTLFQESGVDLLTLEGDTPTHYARVLMSHLFTKQEMARSRYVSQRSAKPSLDAERRQLLEGRYM